MSKTQTLGRGGIWQWDCQTTLLRRYMVSGFSVSPLDKSLKWVLRQSDESWLKEHDRSSHPLPYQKNGCYLDMDKGDGKNKQKHVNLLKELNFEPVLLHGNIYDFPVHAASLPPQPARTSKLFEATHSPEKKCKYVHGIHTLNQQNYVSWCCLLWATPKLL